MVPAARDRHEVGQRRYSDLAIETALTLRLLYHLPLRPAEGFLHALLLGWLCMLDLACHTWVRPLSRLTGLAVAPFQHLSQRVPWLRRHGYLLATVVDAVRGGGRRPPDEAMTTDPIGGGALVERWFLRMMLVVSIVAWLALLLAEAGQFRLVPILLIVWGGGLILLVFIRSVLAAAAGILLCALCALLLLTPYETAVSAGDASVYLNFGRQIAREGALEFEDPLLRPLSPADRAALFRNQVPLDRTGPFARFPGGFQIPDIAEPTVTAGFSPLFPVLTALGHALGPPKLALLVAPIFAILSLIGLWCVARRLGGVPVAWITVALTAVSLPQIWFAKLSLPETVAQGFVMAGVLAWLVASSTRTTGWAMAAGWFFGLACFAKVDFLVFMPVVLLAMVAARLLTRARRDAPPILLALCATFGLFLVHNLAHYLRFDSHYWPAVESLIQTSAVLTLLRDSSLMQAAVGGTAGLLVATGVAALRRPLWLWPRRLLGVAAVGVLVAYGVNYVLTTTNRLDETILWLSWYASWPVLGLAVLGVLGLGLARRADAQPGLGFVALLLGVVGFHYLYNPLETGLQMDSMRRYVPVVLPFTMFFGAWAAVTLLARVVVAQYRVGVTLATGALLVGLVARPSLAVVGQPLWDDASRRPRRWRGGFLTRRSCWWVPIWQAHTSRHRSPTSMMWMRSLSRSGIQTTRCCDASSGDWLANGRAVFLALGQQEFSFFAPDFVLEARDPAHIDLRALERTRARAPQAIVPTPIQLQLFQVTRTRDREPPDVDIGTPADDLLYDLHGFHAPERDPARGTFRWTGPSASLTLPAEAAAPPSRWSSRAAGHRARPRPRSPCGSEPSWLASG